MRRMSKFMAVLSAFIILVSMFVLPTSAATNINYSVSSATGAMGDTVTVTVKASSSIGMTAASININFDSSKLQYVSGTAGSAFDNCRVKSVSSSSVLCTGMTPYDEDAKKSGTFATLKFKILASSGTASLTISPSSSSGDHCGVGTPPTQLKPVVSNGKITVSKAVTGITLNKTSITLKKGETASLTATVTPSDATNKTVTYYTSDKYVAKVSSNGTITAVGGGTATITAKAEGKTATCKVSVNVAQTGIAVSGNASKTVAQGSTLALKVAKVPSDATDNFSTTWTSADTNIATVSAKGVVTGIALGETTITAKQNGWTVIYKITVTEKVEDSSTEESSTDENTTEPITEPTTDLTTTEPVTEPAKKDNFFKTVWAEINDENNKVTKLYHYIVMVMVAVIVGAIASTVTYLVTSGYYKSKLNKKDKE